MERISIEEGNIEAAVVRAAEVLRAGGVVLYPTDTLYALGVDALSDTAVASIYERKGREEKKPVHAIVSDLEMAGMYGEVNDAVKQLAERFGGSVTFIVKKKTGIESGITRGLDTFGFRIPSNAFCIALAGRFGAPITTTSANRSGMAPMSKVDDILSQLGEGAQKIDLVIDEGKLPERLPSTVIDLSGSMPKIVREGAVLSSEIESFLSTV